MTLITHRRIFLTLALAVSFSAPILALLSSLPFTTAYATGGTNSGTDDLEQRTSSQAGCTSCQDAADADKPHLLAASYYSLVGNLTATLMLNNKGPEPLEVRPTLFSLAGERLEVPPVTVEGRSFREIDLREFGIAGTSFEQGSIQLFYRGKDLVLGAQVTLVDSSRSLIFDEKLVELATEFRSQRLEGVWWLPSPQADINLVVSNTTETTLVVTASVEGIAPRLREPVALSLSPHETRILNLHRDIASAPAGALSTAGGVSLEHSGSAGALLARMLIEESSTGYSSWVRFTDPQKGKSSRLHGAGLRLGRVAGERLTPIIVARNVGQSATTVTGRIPFTLEDGTSGSVSLPDTYLAAGEVKLINVTSAIRRSRIEQSLATAGLEFEHTGAPGSVLISARSVSESRNHAFVVPLWDIAAQRSSTGGYPWDLSGTSTTLVYIKNVTDRQQSYALELMSNGQQQQPYVLGVRRIEAGQTVALDIRRLRDEQVPDERGRTISLEATSGQIHWSVRSADRLPLIGRAEQVDVAQGLSSSYACQNCCPDSFDVGFISPTLVATLPGSINQFVTEEIYRTCYGAPTSPNIVYGASWWSSDTAVMAVDGGGLGTAVSLGDSNVNSSWTAYQYYFSSNESGNPNEVGECVMIVISPEVVAPAQVITLRISVPNSPTRDFEASNTFAGVVAGEQASVFIEAVDRYGNVVCRDITFNTVPSRQLGETEVGLPSSFTMSCGQYAGTMTLNRVNGTERGTSYRFQLTTDGSLQDFQFFTYFRVLSSRIGLPGERTWCNHVIQPNDRFVALPVDYLCNQPVQVRNPTTYALDATTVRDKGPHYPGPGTRCEPTGNAGDPYWNTGTRPKVESQTCEAGDNNAGIDLADGTYYSLGSPFQVIWRFD